MEAIMIVITVSVVMFVYCFMQWYTKNYRYMKAMKKFPNPPIIPLIGNALDLKSPTDFISTFAKYTKLYGDTVKLYFGPMPTKLLVTDIQLLEHILSSTTILKKGPEYKFLFNWLGDGLLLSDGGARWKKHRRLINPSFTIQILKDFVEIFESNAKILVNKLERELENTSFDIYPYVTRCSLDIICESAMGTSTNAQSDKSSTYVACVKLMCGVATKRGFSVFLRFDFFYNFFKLSKDEKDAIRILHDYTTTVIKKRKEYYEVNIKNSKEHSTKKSKMVLLDLLLQQNDVTKTFTDEQIREEVDTFTFAGHDTTASAITFAIFCLAENPSVQDKVFEELSNIFADDEFRSITFYDLQSMKYLEAVIKEVLRLYPSVPYFTRTVEEDFEFGGVIVPKGVSIIINAYGIHHDPRLYPDPERFDPDRFLDENISGRRCYLPFSSGPRNCIGQKFAMLEMKTVLAVLLRHYKLLPAIPKHELNLCPQTVLLSTNGVHVGICKRNL